MKKLIYSSLLFIGALLFTACDDYLDTDSPSKQSDDKVFNSLSFTEASLMGIYGTLTESYVYGQKISTNWPTNSDIEFASLTTDNYKSPTRDQGASNYYASQDNQNQKWDMIYKAVELASSAVDGIRKSELLQNSDSTLMKVYLGEALTLKALLHFELVKHYGDIPFKRESSKSDLSNVYIGRVDRDTVYKHILNDLLEAQGYLPWLGNSVKSKNYSSADRITKGFAKGLAARVALFAGGWSIRDRNLFPDMDIEVHPEVAEVNGYPLGRTKDWRRYYEIAAQQCAEILGSADNPHDLDDFENLWKTVNQLQYNTKNENLFEVAFGLGNSGDVGNLIGMRMDSGTKFGSIGLGGSNVMTNAYYFYSFDQDDKRRDVTVTNISYSSDNKEKFNTGFADWRFAKWRFYWMTDAYKALHKEATSGRVSTGINWIVMRYSDIYLMFAEAQNELYGSTAVNAVAGMSAKDALEKVRERAFGAGSPKIAQYDTDFFAAIVNERAWEFGGEALRKYDLVRWGLLSKKIEDQKTALCRMLDGKGTIQIFDKTYQVEDFPTEVYYKFSTTEYIDRASISYYTQLITPPDDTYLKASWLSNAARKDIKNNITKVLIASTGLNAAYDYTTLISEMDSVASITAQMSQYSIGNGVCNYRHPFAIFSKNVTDSQGKIKNSYGY